MQPLVEGENLKAFKAIELLWERQSQLQNPSEQNFQGSTPIVSKQVLSHL